jgi:hypothetical protein
MMNWITSGGKPVDLSLYSCKNAESFFDEVQKRDDSQSSLLKVLREIKEKSRKTFNKKLASILLDEVAVNNKESVMDFFLSLENLKSKKAALEQNIALALSVADESQAVDTKTNSDIGSTVSLDVSANKSVSFSMLGPEELKSFHQHFEALSAGHVSCLKIQGESRSALEANTLGIASYSIDKQRKRTLKLYSRQDQLSITSGMAMSRALNRVPDIGNLSNVADMLGAGICDHTLALEWRGDSSLNSGGNVNATFITQAGTINIELKAEFDYGTSFVYHIHEVGSRIHMTLLQGESAREFNSLGLRYRFGLDSFGPAAVEQLMKVFQKGDAAFTKLSNILNEDFSVVLTPGALLKDFITEKVNDWQNDIVAQIPKFQVDIPVDYVKRIESAINEQADLFTLDVTGNASRLISQILPFQAVDSFGIDVRESLKDSVIVPILGEFQTRTHEIIDDVIKDDALNEYIAKVTGLVDDEKKKVAVFLDNVRSQLKGIAKQIESRSNNLLAIQYHTSREVLESSSFYVSASFDPADPKAQKIYAQSIASPSALLDYVRSVSEDSDNAVSGVEFEDEWVRHHNLSIRENKQFSLALLDFSWVQKSSLISDVRLVETRDGAQAMIRGQIQRSRSINNKLRYVSVLNSTYLSNGVMTDGSEIIPLGRLELEYGVGRQKKEDKYTLKLNDINDLMARFVKYGLTDNNYTNNIKNKLGSNDNDLLERGISLSVQLAIPPLQLRDFIRYINSYSTSIYIDSMSRIMQYEILQNMAAVAQLLHWKVGHSRIGNFEDAVAGAVYNALSSGSGVNYDELRRDNKLVARKILDNIYLFQDKIAARVNPRSAPSNIRSKARKAESWFKLFPSVIESVPNYFRAVNDLMETPLDVHRIKALATEQETALTTLKPLLQVSSNVIGDRRDWVPARTVYLFDVLQRLYNKFSGEHAPLVVVLKDEDGQPTYFQD